MKHQTELLNAAKTVTFAACQELNGMHGEMCVRAYLLAVAADLLLAAAKSDQHPSYVNEKVSKALNYITHAYREDRTYRKIPLQVFVEVENGRVTDMRALANGFPFPCAFTLISHDVEEESSND